jgi:hypothetical protein
MKKYIFFILIFFCQILYSQEDTIYNEENHRVIVLKLNDPCEFMCPCDTVGNYVIYDKKGRVQMKGKVDEAFFINIPIGLKISPSFHNYKIIESAFSDNERTVIVSYYYDQNNEEPVFSYSLFCELEDESIRNKIWRLSDKNIDDNKYFGYYMFDKYFVYYYNVEYEDVEMFNKSIKSIRNEKY